MKIAELETKKFAALNVGDVFIFNHVTWMKINPITVKDHFRGDHTVYNTIMLEHPYAHGDIGPSRKCELVSKIETMTNPDICRQN
jgi:hypothetical protein